MFLFCPGDCPFESKPSPTSAHACGEVTNCMPAAKRLAHVTPEVDLRECTLHLPPQKANKAEPPLAMKPRGDITRNRDRNRVPVAPKKDVCPPKTFLKKSIINFIRNKQSKFWTKLKNVYFWKAPEYFALKFRQGYYGKYFWSTMPPSFQQIWSRHNCKRSPPDFTLVCTGKAPAVSGNGQTTHQQIMKTGEMVNQVHIPAYVAILTCRITSIIASPVPWQQGVTMCKYICMDLFSCGRVTRLDSACRKIV